MPQDAVAREWTNDELMNSGRRQGTMLLPLSWGNMQYLRAEEGMGAVATADPLNLAPETDSIAFAFNTGELWSIDTSVLGIATREKQLYLLAIARTLVPKMREYGQFLCGLGLHCPAADIPAQQVRVSGLQHRRCRDVTRQHAILEARRAGDQNRGHAGSGGTGAAGGGGEALSAAQPAECGRAAGGFR